MKQYCKTCIYKSLPHKIVRFDQKEVIFIEGYDLNHVYLIEEGLVKVSKLNKNGDERIIDILGKDDFIALLGALRKDKSYVATSEALSPVVLRQISVDTIFEAYEKNSLFKDLCLDCMVSKSNVLQTQLYNSINDDVEEKILYVLQYLSLKFGRNEGSLYYLELPFSKTVLSSIIGIRRETLSRKLKLMQDHKIIVVENNKYQFTIND